MKLPYDKERCEALLPIISDSAAKARSLGDCAIDRLCSGIVADASEGLRLARLAASYALRWQKAWVEHSARLTGDDVRDARVCWEHLR